MEEEEEGEREGIERREKRGGMGMERKKESKLGNAEGKTRKHLN